MRKRQAMSLEGEAEAAVSDYDTKPSDSLLREEGEKATPSAVQSKWPSTFIYRKLSALGRLPTRKARKRQSFANNIDEALSSETEWLNQSLPEELIAMQNQLEEIELRNMSIHQLSREGDVSTLRKVLNRLSKEMSRLALARRVNELDADNYSSTHYAARYNHFQCLRLLVEYGADVNLAGEDKVTPLHFAARYKRNETTSANAVRRQRRHTSADVLKRSNSTPDVDNDAPTTDGEGEEDDNDVPGKRSSTGDIPELLRPKTQVEVENIITYLIRKGGDPNAQDLYGLTPLHFAAVRANTVVAQQLVRQPTVDLTMADAQGMTALHSACAHGSLKIVALLLATKADIRQKDVQQSTPLHLAAQDGYLEIIKMLLNHLGDDRTKRRMYLEEEDYERNTALHLAVTNRHFQVAKHLLRQGAASNTHKTLFNTPLHAASSNGDINIVELLLRYGAKINFRNAGQQTPIHRAAAFDHRELIKYLHAHGADVDCCDGDGYTPLLLACGEGRLKAAEILLEIGADMTVTEKMDKSVIFLAAEFNQEKILKLLFRLQARVARSMVDKSNRYMYTPLHIAAEKGYEDIVKFLLDNGADSDAKDEEEQTALHVAAQHGRTRVVRDFLQRHKELINTEDEDSNTPLHIAATNGHEQVVSVLLRSGATIDARNAVLWTPLDCAAAGGWVNTVRILLENDAPVDAVDKTKTTPLHLAAARGHTQVVKALLTCNASIGVLDSESRNCLDVAIEHGHKDVAMAIVSDERYMDVMHNPCVGDDGGLRSPMRRLIKRLPDVAEEVFKRCTTTTGTYESPDFEIHFDFELLDDTYCVDMFDGRIESPDYRYSTVAMPSVMPEKSHAPPQMKGGTSSKGREQSAFTSEGYLKRTASKYSVSKTTIKQHHPLMIMVKSEREHLLRHPLVTALLRHKWDSFGKYAYYTSLFVYIIFLSLLTGYVLITPAPYRIATSTGEGNVTDDVLSSATCMDDVKMERTPFTRLAKWLCIALCILHFIKEFYQMFVRRWQYISYDNIMEWVVYVGTLIFVLDLSDCAERTGLRYTAQWQLGAACVFLAWINLILMIRKLPLFGIYVVMFTDILNTFTRFFVVFILFITSFALAFFALFQNVPSFETFPRSVLKTVVMMIGEFEYDDLFHPDEEGLQLQYMVVSQIIFAVFVITMTILIMNLLVGLAVDDIKGVQEKAALTRLAMTVEMVLDVEQALPEWIRRKYMIGHQTLHPHRHAGTVSKIVRSVFTEPARLSVEAITKTLVEETTHMADRNLNEKMHSRVEKMRRQVDELVVEQQRTHSMLRALIKAGNIEWEDQDQFCDGTS